MTRTTRFLPLAVLLALAACTSDDGSESPPTNGGASGACPATTEIADVQSSGSFLAGGVKGLSLIQTAGDYVYLHDYNAGNDTGIPVFPKTGAIIRAPKAGGAAEVFYVPSDVGETIASFHVSGDDLRLQP